MSGIKNADAAGTRTSSDDNDAAIPKAQRRCFHWSDAGTTKKEKWLIFKLDVFVLFYICSTFFVKHLDQVNVTNAYVSGMKEELGFHGNELNWFTTYFNIGIIIGAPFSTIALTVIHPRYWLPVCSMIWSLFVLFMYKADSARTICILRFFAGLFESGAMPGAFYLIGSWYRSSEINRRSTVFMFSAVLGQMVSGYIQAGLFVIPIPYNISDAGLSAWRWLFIIDFVIGIPIAVFGFICCPDEPKSSKPWWMTKEERQMCIRRLAEEKRDAEQSPWNQAVVKRILSSWQLYAFCLGWGFMELTCGANQQRRMSLYLKSLRVDGHNRYSVEQINDLPTAAECLELVWMIISATIVDMTGYRSPVLFALGAVQLFAYVVFAVWPSNEPLLMAVYYLCSAYGAIAPLISAWLNQTCHGDKQLRAVATSLMISIGYAIETPAQQYMFPISEAPRFQKTHGYIFGSVWVGIMILWLCIALPLIERYFKRRKQGEVEYNISTSDLS